MKKITHQLITAVLASSFLFAHTAFAHDASKHKKKEAEKPRCEALKNMDHSKMDANDPIMQAMMKQCASKNEQHTLSEAAHGHENMKGEHGEEGHRN